MFIRTSTHSQSTNTAEKIQIAAFNARPGGHCESSAMLNALSHLGYSIAESDIIGGGAAPSFFFTDEGFPFLGGRNESMRETFFAAAKIPYHVVVPTTADDDWADIGGLLNRGLPVLIRVDMRYLPYLYGGKFGPAYMSFGWHWICLVELNFASGEALVTDTAHTELQRIALRDLGAARSSKTRIWPPRKEYAWIEPKPADWRFNPDALAGSGISGVLANYERGGGWEEKALKAGWGPLTGIEGLSRLPDRLSGLATRVNIHTLAPAWHYLADSIERNGTGGGAFRRLYAAFLSTRAHDCRDADLHATCSAAAPLAAEAATVWTNLSLALDEAATSLEEARGVKARKAAAANGEAATAEAAGAVCAAEKALLAGLHGL